MRLAPEYVRMTWLAPGVVPATRAGRFPVVTSRPTQTAVRTAPPHTTTSASSRAGFQRSTSTSATTTMSRDSTWKAGLAAHAMGTPLTLTWSDVLSETT